ncbi:MAG: ATP-grasp domain-containing protein [Candidatus Moranbacteria bacterium]|nr:ATP-grasp domain-containing protein [Candidatus Moranbacteria bacterium]
MKTILILFSGNSTKSPQSGKMGYEPLYSYFKKNKIKLCRSSISFYDEEKNIFKKAQFFENRKWIWKKNISPNVVYDKSSYSLSIKKIKIRELIEKSYTFYNSLKLSKLMSDKDLTYQQFKNLSPKSVTLNKKSDLEKINELKTQKIIIKPLSLSGGEGIFVTEKKLLKNNLEKVKFPVIIQEFIDSSNIKNDLVNSYHDIRVIIRNKTPFYSFARFPKKNSYLANISQGGTLKVIPIEDLLKNNDIKIFIDNIIDEIDKIDANKKLYAIDFMFDNNNKIWLIELNSRPGLILEKEEMKYQKEFYEDLLKFFK